MISLIAVPDGRVQGNQRQELIPPGDDSLRLCFLAWLLGAATFLPKPISRNDILQALRRLGVL
jgi:hypothetical protein